MEKHYTYIFRPIVQTPWGEMQVTITLLQTNWFDAQKVAIRELQEWKRSQESLQRNDYPWLDQAIEYINEMQGPAAVLGRMGNWGQVDINWFDERQP